MPSWKKVITSGSDAALNSLLVTTSVTASIFSGSYTGSLFGTSSWAQNTVNASTIDISVFGSPVDSYVLMSNVAGTTGVAIGGDADFRYNSSTNVLTVGTVSATSLTGSLLGTSSWSNRSVTASFVTGSIYTGENIAASASFATTASFSTRATSASGLSTEGLGVINSGQVFVSLITGLPSSFNRFSYSSPLKYNASSDNLTTTSSWATSSISASYVNGSIFVGSNQVVSSSFASTSSFVNTLNQNVLITGSLSIGTSSILLNENTLVIGPPPAGGTGEGGQISLQAPGGTYTSASMWDNWQNYTRLLRGTNTGSDSVIAQFNMHSKQVSFPQYNSLAAFSGTPIAALGVNSSGDIITIQTGSQAGGSGVIINNNTDNYLLTATGTGNTINGESNLQFNGSTLSVTGNVTATSITASGAIIAQANNQMYFRGGDDAELWDINAVNTVGIYGQQTQAEGSIKLGSNGSRLYGSGSNLGINTTTPNLASLHVAGNVFATSFTGSLLGTSSWANNVVTASYVTGSIFVGTNQAASASYAISASMRIGELKTKAGSVANTSFGGSPRTASVSFTTAFPNTSYAITVTGEDNRTWMVQSKTAAGFTINSNSIVALTGTTYWMATVYGES